MGGRAAWPPVRLLAVQRSGAGPRRMAARAASRGAEERCGAAHRGHARDGFARAPGSKVEEFKERKEGPV